MDLAWRDLQLDNDQLIILLRRSNICIVNAALRKLQG
jgi:hypothetical protein